MTIPSITEAIKSLYQIPGDNLGPGAVGAVLDLLEGEEFPTEDLRELPEPYCFDRDILVFALLVRETDEILREISATSKITTEIRDLLFPYPPAKYISHIIVRIKYDDQVTQPVRIPMPTFRDYGRNVHAAATVFVKREILENVSIFYRGELRRAFGRAEAANYVTSFLSFMSFYNHIKRTRPYIGGPLVLPPPTVFDRPF